MVSSSLAVEATGMMRGDKAITYLRCLVGVLVDLLGSIGGGEGGGEFRSHSPLWVDSS